MINQRVEQKGRGEEWGDREEMKKERGDSGKKRRRKNKKKERREHELGPGARLSLVLCVLAESPWSPCQITWCMKNSILVRPMAAMSPNEAPLTLT